MKVINDVIKSGIRGMSADEIEEALFSIMTEMNALPVKDLLSIFSFYKYLEDKSPDKVFVTNPRSIVAKNAKVFRKLHNCKIRVFKY
jgi:hypothetical protein